MKLNVKQRGKQMKVSEMFTTIVSILGKYDKEHPKETFEIDGSIVKVKDIVTAMNKLLGWLYKDLTTDNIEKITRCYDCKYYKKYRKKGDMKSACFYACSQDKKHRRPDFYCKDGEPRR